MKIKSYFAGSVEAAMAQARSEFGPDAMLMNTRKTLAEARHLGEYEVVFACPNAPEQPAATATSPTENTPAQGASDSLLKEIADLRRQMERMAAGVNRAKSLAATNVLTDPVFANMFSALLATEIEPELANTVLNTLRSRGVIRADEIGSRLRTEVEHLCATDAALGRPGANRVVALIGPPGSGKTTCLAKLAIHFGLSARRPTQFLTLDTERIAAADQLHTFAEILGCGFRAHESTHSLSQALEEHRNKHLVLIDTPGIGPRDIDTAESLAAFFSRRDDIDVHLVLPCNIKPSDLAGTVERFADFNARKLLFTRLDETRTYGVMLNESVRTGKPISFLSTGQRIPEDFEVATQGRIASLVLGELGTKASVAAA